MSRASLDALTATEQMGEVRELFLEYANWLGFSLCFQGFDQELADLPGKYAPPRGRLYVAHFDGAPAGCVALRPLDTRICEMKRLWVRPAYRGIGLGRQLGELIVEQGSALGYDAMRLDTIGERMQDAVRLYRSLGFVEIDPYYDNPESGVLFMEKRYR